MNNDFFYNNKEYKNIILKYEEMRRKKSSYFFDVHEFEEIISYYLELDKPENALEVAKFASIQHPNASSIQLKYAEALIQHDQPESALRILNKLGKIEASNYEFHLLKGSVFVSIDDIEKAKECFDKAENIAYDERNDVLQEISRILVENGEYELAIEYLQSLYKLNKKNIQTIYDLASCYNNTGNTQRSIQLYQDYLDFDPFADSIWFNLGILYTQQEEFEKAIEAFDFSIAITNDFSSTHYYKAIAQMNLGKYSDAIETYKDFIDIDEESEEIYCFIAECYERMKDYDNSLLFYDKSIKLNPKYADAWYGKGIVLKLLGRFGESVRCVKKAIKNDEENSEYWYGLGEIYLDTDNKKEALKAFRKALEIDPYDSEAWLNYSEVYYLQGKIDMAISTLNEAYQYNYDVALINYRMAAYFLSTKNINNACKYFERGLNLNKKLFEETFKYYPLAKDIARFQELIEQYKK